MKNLAVLSVVSFLSLTSVSSYAAPGAYLQAQGGIGGMNTTYHTTTSADYYDEVSIDRGLAYRLSTGYLWGQNNFNYGLEAGYSGYPQNKYTEGNGNKYTEVNGTVETYNGNYIDLLGVAKYNFSGSDHGFFVTGKAGMAYLTQKFEADFPAYLNTPAYKKTVTGYKPEVAVGTGYNFSQKVSMDLSYQHVFASEADPAGNTEEDVTKLSSVNTLLLGLTFHF